MAKATDPKDKDLEADILNEAANTSTNTAAAGSAEPPINQEELKKEAENLSAKAQTETPAPKVAQPEEKIDPAAANEAPKANSTTASIPQTPGGNHANPGNVRFTVPQYLQENGPKNQEEIDAISTFLENYRKKPGKQNNAEQLTQEEHNVLEGKYGKGFVKARRGNNNQVFTAITWQRMGGNNNQDGWREVVQTPPEVKGLKAGQ